MKRYAFHLAFSVAVLVATAITLFGLDSFVPAATPPLVAKSAELTFGEAWLQDPFSHTFQIENRSSQTVTIRSFNTSCNCTAVTADSMVLLPGDKTTVTAHLKVVERGDVLAKSISDFSVHIWPMTNHEIPSGPWIISGSFRSPFVVVTPHDLRWPRLPLELKSEPQRLRLWCRPEVADVKAELAADLPDDEILQIVRADWHNQQSGVFDILLRVNPNAPAGEHDTLISLTALNGSGTSLATLPYRVTCPILADVYASPEQEHFGVAACGSVMSTTIQISSRTGLELSFQEARNAGNVHISLRPWDSGTDAAWSPRLRFDLQIAAENEGPQVEEVTFLVVDSKGNQHEIPFSLSYLGVMESDSEELSAGGNGG